MDLILVSLVAVRWLHFGAMFGLFGAAMFEIVGGPDMAASDRTISRCIRGAAFIALVTGAFWLAVTLVDVNGGLDGLDDLGTYRAFFLDTVFGPIEAARLGLLVLVAGVAFAPMPDGRRRVLVAFGSGALLVSQAWLGHAAEGGETWRGLAAIACYGLHVLAAAVWLGTLPLLLAHAIRCQRGESTPSLLRGLSRYSLSASLAVSLVIATGIANVLFRSGAHVGALMTCLYGAVLGLKLALVMLMLAFASYNRFVAMPRLAARPERASTMPLVASIASEIGLGILVLAAAAVLGVTPPPA